MKGLRPEQREQTEDIIIPILQDIIKTKEIREIIGAIVPDLMGLWAGNSSMKRMVTEPVGKVIQNGIYREIDETAAGIQTISDLLPELFDKLFESLRSVNKTIDTLTPDEKETLIADLLSKVAGGNTGESITVILRMMNEIHDKNPDFLTASLEPGFKKWVEDIDFGELREFLDKSEKDVAALIKMIFEVLWQYPSKLIIILSLLPDVTKILLTLVKEVSTLIDKLSPDLLTDVLLSFLREIDGKIIGECVNGLNEVLRKVHTGSALLGDPGSPQFPIDLSNMVEAAADVVNMDAVWKTRKIIAEGKQAINEIITNILKNDPEKLTLPLRNYAALRNPSINALRYKLEAFEESPEDDIAESAANGISDLDFQEMAEIVNLSTVLVNRIRNLKPELTASLVSQFIDSLDLYEIQDAVSGLTEDLTETLRPLGRVVFPQIINGVSDILSPADDEYEEEVAASRLKLRSLLMGEEVPS